MQCHSSVSHGSRVSQAIRQAITGNVAKLFCSLRPSLKNASRNGCLGWKRSTSTEKYRLLVSMWVDFTWPYRCSVREESRRCGCSRSAVPVQNLPVTVCSFLNNVDLPEMQTLQFHSFRDWHMPPVFFL